MGKRVITFSIYGTTKRYTHGLLEAIVSYKMLFINWEIWVYISKRTLNTKLVDIIKNFGCNVIIQEEIGDKYEIAGIGPNENSEPTFWRFTPIYNKEIDFCISRDADSRATEREKNIVDDFIESNKAVHTILDHRCHHGLMAGMVGFNVKQLQNYNIPNFNDFIQKEVEFNKRTTRGKDQSWLRESFKEPIVNRDIYIHVNRDIIDQQSKKNISFENIMFLHNVLIADCCHKIIETVPNFIGKQIQVDHTENDKKIRTNVYLPIVF
jgi:hypothetical protein